VRNAIGVTRRCAAVGHAVVKKLEKRGNRRKEIVQVVGHAARHPAQQLQFFRGQDFLFQANLVDDYRQLFDQLRQQTNVVGV